MNLADEIQRLHELHQSGALTDAEFVQAKAKLLKESPLTDAPQQAGAGNTLNQLNRFRRSKNDQWLAGICGGLGKLTGLESWVWRLLFVTFSFYFGFGLVAYIVAWIFVPEED
jgi:phage shock protein C